MRTHGKHRSITISRNIAVVGGLLIVILIGVRLALPYWVKDYVNDKLQQMDSYVGHVERIHIALWRGAYTINDIVIEKKSAQGNESFFSADQLQLAVQWRALFRGSVVGTARFNGAELNLIQSENKAERQLGNENNWNKTLSDLFPFTFNEITVVDGIVRFRAPGISRKEALVVHSVDFSLRNLTNVFEADQIAYANFDLEGILLGDGTLNVDGKLDPYAEDPTFEVEAELQKVQLPELNPWLETYAGVNAKKGTFAIYTEFAAAKGKFKGYAKPIATDIDVTAPKEDKDNIFRKAWAGLVELAAKIFRNQSKDQLATRIPISGDIDDPNPDVLRTILNILRNAFVSAFSSSLEHSVNLRDLEKEAGSDKDNSEDEDEQKDKDKKN
ncbi:MAG TPA: DUF748 domain-containing protein [Dongiaceae bacterium]|nr:DUF748 domain-containing protein [Dongiaceae bacterium]